MADVERLDNRFRIYTSMIREEFLELWTRGAFEQQRLDFRILYIYIYI